MLTLHRQRIAKISLHVIFTAFDTEPTVRLPSLPVVTYQFRYCHITALLGAPRSLNVNSIIADRRLRLGRLNDQDYADPALDDLQSLRLNDAL